MRFLKQNTATRITVGPFIDKTDGITPEITLTVTSCLLTFVVDDGGVPTLVIDAAPTASGGDNDMVHITSDAAGYYDLELTAAQTNYVGRATLSINDVAVHCPVFHEYMILPANVYDALMGTDRLLVDAAEISSDSAAADALETMLDGTGGNKLSLSQLNIVAAANDDAIVASGSGTGRGLVATGGATGHGAEFIGGATSGDGARMRAAASGDGLELVGAGSNHGLRATGAGAGSGIGATGAGSGEGITATGGSTGHGIEAVGGATSGDGIRGRAPGVGAGLGAFGLAGNGIEVEGSASGILVTADGNGHAMELYGSGTGSGIMAMGGATGHGVKAVGGGTSGDGINAAATTLGDGMELVGAGGGLDLNGDIAVTSIAANAVSASALATDAVDEIADGVWNEPIAGHVAAGSVGEALNDVATDIAAVAAAVWSVGTRTLTGIASGIIASAELNNIADALLKRDMSAVTGEAARSPLNALRFLRNKWSVLTGTLTVYKEDDTASAWTATVTQDAASTPITVVDP